MLGRRGGEADPENGMVVLVDGPLGTDAGETGPVEGIGDHGGEEHLVSWTGCSPATLCTQTACRI